MGINFVSYARISGLLIFYWLLVRYAILKFFYRRCFLDYLYFVSGFLAGMRILLLWSVFLLKNLFFHISVLVWAVGVLAPFICICGRCMARVDFKSSYLCLAEI